MITADGEKIVIKGDMDDTMSESVQIVKAITDIAWSIIDEEEDPDLANYLIKELSRWAADIIDAVMPELEVNNMSLRKETPCDFGPCPYDAEYSCTCDYYCSEIEDYDEESYDPDEQ